MIGTAQQLFTGLSRGERLPFYAVLGDEPFQSNEILQRLKDAFLPQGDDPFAWERFDGEGLDVGAFLRSLDQMPGLFGDPSAKRLVICTRFDKVSAAGLERLEKYFADPSPDTSLVLVAAKGDKRRLWFKAAEKAGFVVEVADPRDRDWPRWHKYFEKRAGKAIEPEAWERLLVASQGKLAELATEVEKLALYVGKETVITGEDAAAALDGLGAADLFGFVDDVVEGRKLAAMIGYRKLADSGESDVKLLALVARQMQLLDRVAVEGIRDSKVLAQVAGVHPFAAQKAVERARHKTPAHWARGVRLVAQADFRMKTGKGDFVSELLLPWLSERNA